MIVLKQTPRFSRFLALFGLLTGWGNIAWGSPQPDSARSPAAKPSSPPNVLLIVSDDLRAGALPCYGDPLCQTPNLDRLASRSVVFHHAYCQGTWCAPSRQSFMHSRYQGKGPVNLGQHLISQGYHSARVGKIFHMRVPGDIIAGTNGLDVASCWSQRFNSAGQEAHTPGDYACLNLNVFTTSLENRQSTRMPHRPFVTVQYDGDGSDQPDHKSASKAIELLRERAAEQAGEASRPFFLAVGLVRPHYPMVAPRKYFAPYPWDKIKLPEQLEGDWQDIPREGISPSNSAKVGFDKYPQNQPGMWAGYYATITFMDEQVGRILDELERLELADNTLVIFTSDHGYHLGDHGFWQKSNLHEQVTRVPLIIHLPGGPAGVSQAPVELVDLFPTITDFAGLPTPDSVQGQSLMPILKDPRQSVRDAAISLHRGISVRSRDFAYLRYANGAEELYDMRSDPNQFHNLVQRPTDTSHAELNRHRRWADQKIQHFGLNLKAN